MKGTKYTKEILEILTKESSSFSEILRKMNKAVKGGNVNHLKNRINEFNIDISHFRGRGWKKFEKGHIPKNILDKKKFEDLYLKEGSNIITDRLKSYCIRFGCLENKCNKCKNDGNWNGSKLTLQIDHINGIRDDNRIGNLRILCPNCHSQTDTYSGKRRDVKENLSVLKTVKV